ncbi:Protease HtpX [Acaryochloris thomasi RCC1774]|uniref:Protease HtpX n=1 Tax=Acaryochloris thomasi RCC1774 TaxID=1764569 RepID=A0A2W1K0A4_9CYAN|nr:M48 family metallopeptidase [Acaryochloris thomasi]PZD73717.1 Protease HtpX [Acaryochloris thomasi RCC1774]
MNRWLTRLHKQKISTPEDFDALVQKIEVVARRNPVYYRSRLKLLACLGYGYILTVFSLLFAALWGLRQLLIESQSYEFVGQIKWVALLIFAGLVNLFVVKAKPPPGITLTRKLAPALFAVIDELTSALKAPRINKIILDDDLNAAVMQRPWLGLIGWHTNYLLIGLPLMQALSPEQCKAVIAHELAHLRGGDGRVSAWIYRIRHTWYELAERFGKNSSGGFLFHQFFSWYGPYFKAYSFVHARSQEYEADRLAANLTGVQHKAEALIWLYVNGLFVTKEFWPDFQRRTLTLIDPPDNFVSQLLAKLRRGMTLEQSHDWLALSLARQTTNASTHPCLTERIEALGYTVETPLYPPTERATALLGDRTNDFAKQLDQLWQTEETKNWQDKYDCHQRQLDCLNRLSNKSEHLLTIEEKIKQASLIWTLQDPQAALPLFQAILEQEPEDTVVRYWVGFLLSEQGNEAGIPHLEFVADRDPSLLISACQQLYPFYLKQDRGPEAEDCKQRWQAHENVWRPARTERAEFDAKTQFVPHDLPISEVRQLVESLSDFREVKSVYIVRKVVERFPEHPYYVFAIARRSYQGMGKEYRTDHKLSMLIQSEIAFSRSYTLRFLDQGEPWKRLKQVSGALVYHH